MVLGRLNIMKRSILTKRIKKNTLRFEPLIDFIAVFLIFNNCKQHSNQPDKEGFYRIDDGITVLLIAYFFLAVNIFYVYSKGVEKLPSGVV